MNELPADSISSGTPREDERAEILRLCALASEPYDRFVWRTEARAQEVAEFLWSRDAGEVTAASTMVWRDPSGVLGVLVSLSGLQLRRARLRAAVLIARSAELGLKASEREAARIASATLANVALSDVYLARIAIDTRARGTGLAKSIMTSLALSADSSGANFVVLEVEAENERARSLYESAGYVVTGDREVSDHAGVVLHLVEMRLTLDSRQSTVDSR